MAMIEPAIMQTLRILHQVLTWTNDRWENQPL
jgi:hypothetical protein